MKKEIVYRYVLLFFIMLKFSQLPAQTKADYISLMYTYKKFYNDWDYKGIWGIVTENDLMETGHTKYDEWNKSSMEYRHKMTGDLKYFTYIGKITSDSLTVFRMVFTNKSNYVGVGLDKNYCIAMMKTYVPDSYIDSLIQVNSSQ